RHGPRRGRPVHGPVRAATQRRLIMNRVRTVLCLAAALLVPSLAAAQAAPANTKPPASAQMYEDIEIMRRLLLKAVGGTSGAAQYTVAPTLSVPLGPNNYYPSTSGQTVSGVWEHRVVRGAVGLDGVYLKGQGVVFTATLPPTKGDPRPEGARPA